MTASSDRSARALTQQARKGPATKRPRAFARGLRWMYRDAILYPSSPATETNATQRVCGCFIRNSEYRQNQKDIPRESSRRIVRPETLDCSRKDNSGDAKKGKAADEEDSAKDRRTSGSQRHFTFGHRYHSLGIPGHRSADGAIILPMSRHFEGFSVIFGAYIHRFAWRMHMQSDTWNIFLIFPDQQAYIEMHQCLGRAYSGKITADDAPQHPTENPSCQTGPHKRNRRAGMREKGAGGAKRPRLSPSRRTALPKPPKRARTLDQSRPGYLFFIGPSTPTAHGIDQAP